MKHNICNHCKDAPEAEWTHPNTQGMKFMSLPLSSILAKSTINIIYFMQCSSKIKVLPFILLPSCSFNASWRLWWTTASWWAASLTPSLLSAKSLWTASASASTTLASGFKAKPFWSPSYPRVQISHSYTTFQHIVCLLLTWEFLLFINAIKDTHKRTTKLSQIREHYNAPKMSNKWNWRIIYPWKDCAIFSSAMT